MEKKIEGLISQNGLEILKLAFDLVRIVDPDGKEEVLTENGDNIGCYRFWKLGEPCDNCVSLRALKSGKVESKVEISSEAAYMVTAIPLEGTDRYVLELGKRLDISNLEIQVEDQNKRLSELLKSLTDKVIKDPLTGLFNRNYLDGKGQYFLESGSCVSLAFMDLDNFKGINDRYGHSIGDLYLQKTAEVIKENLPAGGYAVRYGGDEFVIIYTGTAFDECSSLLSRLLEGLNRTDIQIKEEHVNVRASIGAVTSRGSKDMKDLISMADANTYKAKSQGGNNIVHTPA